MSMFMRLLLAALVLGAFTACSSVSKPIGMVPEVPDTKVYVSEGGIVTLTEGREFFVVNGLDFEKVRIKIVSARKRGKEGKPVTTISWRQNSDSSGVYLLTPRSDREVAAFVVFPNNCVIRVGTTERSQTPYSYGEPAPNIAIYGGLSGSDVGPGVYYWEKGNLYRNDVTGELFSFDPEQVDDLMIRSCKPGVTDQIIIRLETLEWMVDGGY